MAGFQYAFHNEIELMAVNAVREFFSTSPVTQDFRFSTDPAKRHLEIVAQWPENPQKFPMIVIDTVYSGEGQRYLSDGADDVLVNGKFEGQYKSGVDNFDLRFSVNAYDKPDVNDIASMLIFGLKVAIEESIWAASLMTVHWQARSARTSGAGARPYTDQQLLHFVNISQPVASHWYEEAVYDEKILTYLATVERALLGGGTDTIQVQAGE
jgi:hypothetical protein